MWRAHYRKGSNIPLTYGLDTFSLLGKFSFLPWKTIFPALEIYFSTVGNFIFQGWKVFWKTSHCDCFTAPVARQIATFVAIAPWGIVVFQWAIGEYPRGDRDSRWRR